LMECSKQSLEDEDSMDHGPDKSALSQIYRLMKQLAGAGALGRKKKQTRGKKQKRLGRGPNRERDMDVDSDSDDSEDEYGDAEEASLVDIRARVTTAGFTESQLNETIAKYEDLNVLVRVANGSKIRFVTADF